jgi:hypothetical protein
MNIQEITEAPVGSTMTITRDGGADEWVRQEGDVWMNPGSRVTLASTFFETPASQNRVSLGIPDQPPVEDWAAANLPHYRIGGGQGIPAGEYPVFERESADQLVILPQDSGAGWVLSDGAVTGAPTELNGRRAWWVDRRFLVEPETVVCTRQHADDLPVPDVAALERAATQWERDRIQEALHTYLDEHDYDRDSDLEEIMVDHLQMERRPVRQETITVSVNIRGYTDIDLGDSDLCPFVDSEDRVEVENTEVRAYWNWTVDVDVEVDEGDCGCDEPEGEQIREALRREGINFTDFEVEDCNCPND